MTYFIEESIQLWLAPCMEAGGIFLQIVAVFMKNRIFFLAGMSMVGVGAVWDRDVALLCGDALASLGLWFTLKND